MLRLIRRDPKRPADLIVPPSDGTDRLSTTDREAITARALPHPISQAIAEVLSDSEPPSDMTPVSEEMLFTSDLIIEPDAPSDRTPVTPHVSWARLIPPPLPESER